MGRARGNPGARFRCGGVFLFPLGPVFRAAGAGHGPAAMGGRRTVVPAAAPHLRGARGNLLRDQPGPVRPVPARRGACLGRVGTPLRRHRLAAGGRVPGAQPAPGGARPGGRPGTRLAAGAPHAAAGRRPGARLPGTVPRLRSALRRRRRRGAARRRRRADGAAGCRRRGVPAPGGQHPDPVPGGRVPADPHVVPADQRRQPRRRAGLSGPRRRLAGAVDGPRPAGLDRCRHRQRQAP